jgi:hypothetical protein
LEDLLLLSSILYDMKHTHTWQKWKPKVKGWEKDPDSHSPTIAIWFYLYAKIKD